MGTRRRIPMVGDHPEVVAVVPVAESTGVLSPLEVTIRREELSSEKEAHEFEWAPWADLMIACLIFPRTLDDLLDYWKANINMLDWAKKVKADEYERIRAAFSAQRKKLEGKDAGI